jgi:hypothetical protein
MWYKYPTSLLRLAVPILRRYGATHLPYRRRINEGDESTGAPGSAPHNDSTGRHRSRCLGKTEAEGRHKPDQFVAAVMRLAR